MFVVRGCLKVFVACCRCWPNCMIDLRERNCKRGDQKSTAKGRECREMECVGGTCLQKVAMERDNFEMQLLKTPR